LFFIKKTVDRYQKTIYNQFNTEGHNNKIGDKQMTTQFKINETYTTFLPGQYDTKLNFQVIKRTSKSIWIQDMQFPKEPMKRKTIKLHRDAEIAWPLGTYNRAPILRAVSQERND
jgi:hypothetical protein